ncbi:MAG: hypothetical protein ACJ73C_16015, partial [Nitrososphaeraceae archaeon]
LILGYHNIDNNLTLSKDAIDIALFDKEMKYLHDNGFKVLTMADLGYDENSKNLYIKNTIFNNGDRMLPRTNNDRKLVKIMSKKIVWHLTRAVVLFSLRRHLIILLCCV